MVLKASFLMKCASSTSSKWKFCPRMLCVERRQKRDSYDYARSAGSLQSRGGAGQVSQVSRQVRRDRRVPTGLRPENRNQSADTGAA